MNPDLQLPAPGTLAHYFLWMGDGGLATVVTITAVLLLVLDRSTRRAALPWASAYVLMTSLVFATKLGLFGWGKGIPSLDFRGPSGHAALSAFIWTMFAWIMTLRASPWTRRAGFLAGSVMAAGTAWVLIAFGFHSALEVAAGSALGGGAACACSRAVRLIALPPRRLIVLAGVSVATVACLQHGRELMPLVLLKWKAHQVVGIAASL